MSSQSALAAFIIRCPTIMLAQEAMASLDIAVALLNTPTSNQNALTIKVSMIYVCI
jgi:ABC-type antimicrobial peptide transport system ATPase subunit